MADGAEFSIDLGVKGGDQATAAASALDALASKLEVAGEQASAAAKAMAAGQSAYDQAENAANRAAVAVEKIGQAVEKQNGKAAAIASEYGLFSPQFEKASAALAALTVRQAEAQQKARDAATAMNAEAANLDKLKAASSAAAAAEQKLSESHDAAKKAQAEKAKADKAAADAEVKSISNAGLLEGALGKLGGPLGTVGQRAVGAGGALLKLSKTLGDAGPYVAIAIAAAAVAAGVAAVGVAAAVAVTKIAVWAVGLADAARTQGLLAAGIARTVEGGALLNAKIDSLTDTLPTTREELLALAGPLADSGLRGKDLTDALEKSATAAAKLKFGPDFAKQMNSIPQQTARIQAGFNKIFSGLKIDALLESLSKVTDLFKENSATANAAKVVFESLFQPIIDGVTAFVPKVVAAFIQFEILVLKAMIAIKPFGSTIVTVAEVLGALALVVGVVLAAAIGLLVAGLSTMAVGIGVAIGVAGAFVAALIAIPIYLANAASSLTSEFGAAIDWLNGLSLAQIGTDLIDGLVAGITSAGPKVLSSITSIATGAIDSAKKALGIASPSKVFAEIGGYTAEGMQQGVEDGAGDVQAATASLAETPALPAGGSADGSSSRGGGGITIENLTVMAPAGTTDPRAWAEAFRDALQDLGAQLGTAVPDAP